jgi:hypothetical protein
MEPRCPVVALRFRIWGVSGSNLGIYISHRRRYSSGCGRRPPRHTGLDPRLIRGISGIRSGTGTGLPYHFSFLRLLHTHHRPGLGQ